MITQFHKTTLPYQAHLQHRQVSSLTYDSFFSEQNQASDNPQNLDNLYFLHFQNRIIDDDIVTYLKLVMFNMLLTYNTCALPCY